MNGFIPESWYYRLLDVTVSVALLLLVTCVLVRALRQPIAKLWVIQCVLLAGLAILATVPFDLPRLSLGLLGERPIARPTLSAVEKLSPSDVLLKGQLVETGTRGIASTLGQDPLPHSDPNPPPKNSNTPPVTLHGVALNWWRLLIVAYGVGALAMAVRLAFGIWTVRRLVRNSQWASGGLAEQWEKLSNELSTTMGRRRTRNIRLLVSNELTYPAAVGLWRCVVLVPAWTCKDCRPDELRPLLAHEWAHCTRRDTATRFLAELFKVAFYYQPLFWWLQRELRVCQEYLADAVAVKLCPTPESYAEQLFELAKAGPTNWWRSLPIAGIVEGRSDLYRRVRMLVNPFRQLQLRAGAPWCVLVAASVLALAQFLSSVTLRTAVAQAVTEEDDATSTPAKAEVRLAEANTEQQLRELLGAAEKELIGIVVDAQGQPLADVKVLVWESDEYKIRTNKSGLFRAIVDVESHDDHHLLLRFFKPGYATHLEVDWHLGHRKSPFAVMSNNTWLEGIVRRPDGQPAAHLLVRANQGPKEENESAVVDHLWVDARTDANGRYKILVDPDWYTIDIRAPGVGTAHLPKPGEKPEDPQPESSLMPEPRPAKLRVAEGAHRVVDIQLDSGVDFRAKLVDSVTRRPVAGVRLWHWQYPDIEGHTDTDGLVTIPTMPEGEFTFMMVASGYVRCRSDAVPKRWTDLRSQSSRQFTLDNGLQFDLVPEMPEVTIELEPGVTISGRVLDPNGLPVAGATVSPARTGTGHRSSSDTFTSQDNGTFIAVLPPSGDQEYNLTVHDGEYQTWRKWANGVGKPLKTKPGDKIDNVELRLTRPGTVRGRVVDAQGKPAAGVYVQTTAADRLEQCSFNPAIRSGPDGRFELPYVRPGKHTLHGWIQLQIPKGGKVALPFSFPEVEVEAGETSDVGDVWIPDQG